MTCTPRKLFSLCVGKCGGWAWSCGPVAWTRGGSLLLLSPLFVYRRSLLASSASLCTPTDSTPTREKMSAADTKQKLAGAEKREFTHSSHEGGDLVDPNGPNKVQ